MKTFSTKLADTKSTYACLKLARKNITIKDKRKIKIIMIHNKKKKTFMKKLKQLGIGTRPFFWPMHEQPVVKKYGIADIEATKSLSDNQIGLLKTSYKEFL